MHGYFLAYESLRLAKDADFYEWDWKKKGMLPISKPTFTPSDFLFSKLLAAANRIEKKKQVNYILILFFFPLKQVNIRNQARFILGSKP